MKRILVLNAGSSSLKYSLFNSLRNNIEGISATGIIEHIGQPKQTIKHKYKKENKQHKLEAEENNLTYKGALDTCLSLLNETVSEKGSHLQIDGVGHRVVHGGEKLSCPKLIDDGVIQSIEEASVLAPLHNPANLTGIRTAMQTLPPDCDHVAVFDTAFHATLPAHAYRYALPTECFEKYGVRKYGFHGTSHEYVMQEAAKYLNKRVESLNMISCHLGAGASVCCIKNGHSIDTSMGMTPLEGLVMATRCGDIDASIVFHLMNQMGLSEKEVEELLVKRSGWHGLCGETNARNIETKANGGEELFVLTTDIIVHRIRKYIGAYLLTLGGKLDAIVFTAGLGENWPTLRRKCMEDLENFGVEMDVAENDQVVGQKVAKDVSTFRSEVKVLVIPTDEEKHIAKQTLKVINS